MPEADFSRFKKKPKIELISYTHRKGFKDYGPDEISAFGALACFEQKPGTVLYDDMWLVNPKEKVNEKAEKVIQASIGKLHGAVADQNAFVLENAGLSRATTLFMCSPQYLSFLQQSLRRADADNWYELPDSILSEKIKEQAVKVMDDAFKLYGEMINDKVPNEDARYVLPLYTKTNIQAIGNARELTHLHAMSQLPSVPSVTKYVIERMVDEAAKVAPKLFKDRKLNYETLAWYPAAQLYAERNETLKQIIIENRSPEKPRYIEHKLQDETIIRAIVDREEAELANLKHVHNGSGINGYLTFMSLVTLHQAIRQRTWDQTVESIYDAAERAKAITPGRIEVTKWAEQYKAQCNSMFELYKMLVAYGIPKNDAIGVIPHSTMIYDLIHINGWNALHSIGKRTCPKAQWEIREIAEGIALEIARLNPKIFAYMGPQCKIYGFCPEGKPCSRFKKSFYQRVEEEKGKE